MMHALKRIRAFLHDDPHQMDHRIAALHALVKPGAFDDVTGHQLSICVFSQVGPLGISNQRTHGMAFCQQSLQHVLADKARCAGEEDFHEEEF